MDLPTVNSTTSISDNVDLKNYYEDLLFKNNSGKSLSDLPRKLNDNSNNSGSDTVDPLAGLNNLRNSIKSAEMVRKTGGLLTILILWVGFRICHQCQINNSNRFLTRTGSFKNTLPVI